MTTLSILVMGTTIPPSWQSSTDKYIPNPFENVKVEALAPLDNVQMGGGLNFSAILKEDGTVWTYGRNDFGTLGQNDFIDRAQPTRIDPAYFNNEKVVQIETSAVSVAAKTETNKVYYWGTGSPKPALIYNNLPVLDIEAAGKGDVNTTASFHIVTSEGIIRNSGSNVNGTFGIGTYNWWSSLGTCTAASGVPNTNFTNITLKSAVMEPCPTNTDWNRVKSGTAVNLDNIADISVSTGNRKLLAYTNAGELFTWGEGTPTHLPVKLPNADLFNIKKIEMSAYPTFLTTEGKLYYYPNNTSTPVEITLENSSSPITDIQSGQDNLLVLDASSKLYGIGPNTYGNLGSIIPAPGVSFSTKKALYTGIDNVRRVGAGVSHTIIQDNDLRFSTLGRNSYGELSTTDVNSKSTFVKNTALTNVKNINAQQYSSYASTGDNKFYSWGGRSKSEIINRSGNINEPGLVKDFSGISNIVDINGTSEAYVHGGVLLENGEFWNFGENWKKSLGTNAISNTMNFPVKNSNSSQTETDFRLKSASQGSYHGTGIGFNNKVYTWGFDAYGMLGTGTTVTESVGGVIETAGRYAFENPIVPSGETFSKIYSGRYENILLTNTGKVYIYGANTNNRFGMAGNPQTFTLLNSLPPIKEVAFGYSHNLFLDYSGNVWSSGGNSYGQLGLGNTVSPSIPTKIPTLKNVKAIGAGKESSYAILQTGELYSFGDNRYGQLGLGDFIQRNEPRLVPGAEDVVEVSGGRNHALFINSSGDLFVTGSDAEGQLGLAQSQVNSTPITVVFPPNVTISTPSNQIFTVNDTVNVTGEVFTETQGVPMVITYQVESQSGKTVETAFKSYSTSSTPETFSLPMPLTSYEPGAYTVVIKAKTNTGVTGQSSISFSIQDKIKPTVSVDVTSTPKWTLSPVSVKVTADDIGGSGYRGYRYAITNTTAKPTYWSTIDPNKTGTISINVSGSDYLHIEAYDNIGNAAYLQKGPYYIDVDPPDFIFNEPTKWQQDHLDLGVTIQEASNLIVKKWLPGDVSMDTVKTSGNDLSSASIPATSNGTLSFYAKDENNQESFETYAVSNINYTPVLLSSPAKILVPSSSKTSYEISTDFSHSDDGDSTKMLIDLGENIITSLNNNSNQDTNQTMDWTHNFSSATENTFYNGQIYLNDSRGGLSNKQNTQLEVYNPHFILKSKLNGMDISWTHSKLSQDYRLLKDGEVIYTGTSNTYFDHLIKPNSSHIYELQVLVDGTWISVTNLNKNDGYHFFETPTSIFFPETQLGNDSPITPSSIDLEYVKYDDLSDIKTPWTISVSITDFTSGSSSFTPHSFVLKNVKKMNRSNLIDKVFPDLYLSDTPIQLVNQTDTSIDAYAKLEILRDNIELSLPSNVTLNSQSSELFQANITWDVTLAP
ncbi:hypothetical protein MZM54_00305 [[Brevibacterium] frigoritolerans]|nr:hypothetical protein [Peribacillus frigoritolerans]